MSSPPPGAGIPVTQMPASTTRDRTSDGPIAAVRQPKLEQAIHQAASTRNRGTARRRSIRRERARRFAGTRAGRSGRRHFLEPLVLAWNNRRVGGILGLALIRQRRSDGRDANFTIAAVETVVLSRQGGRVLLIHR